MTTDPDAADPIVVAEILLQAARTLAAHGSIPCNGCTITDAVAPQFEDTHAVTLARLDSIARVKTLLNAGRMCTEQDRSAIAAENARYAASRLRFDFPDVAHAWEWGHNHRDAATLMLAAATDALTDAAATALADANAPVTV